MLRGGLSAKALGCTWHWNAGAWSPLQDFGSPRRSAHAITYDSYRTRIALFGDESDTNNPQDHSATRGKHLRGRSLRTWLSTRTR